jgi:hypothetical protein
MWRCSRDKRRDAMMSLSDRRKGGIAELTERRLNRRLALMRAASGVIELVSIGK